MKQQNANVTTYMLWLSTFLSNQLSRNCLLLISWHQFPNRWRMSRLTDWVGVLSRVVTYTVCWWLSLLFCGCKTLIPRQLQIIVEINVFSESFIWEKLRRTAFKHQCKYRLHSIVCVIHESVLFLQVSWLNMPISVSGLCRFCRLSY